MPPIPVEFYEWTIYKRLIDEIKLYIYVEMCKIEYSEIFALEY